MKKLFVGFFVSFVFVSLTAASVLAVDKVAVTKTIGDNSPTPIDYDLAYPGMLPDSPIYFVKVARDRIVQLLILSKVNKSFYSMLLSDKRLSAGQSLIESGKTSLGATTVASSEEFFTEAVEQATKAKEDGLEVTELLAKLSVAVVKHQEVISELLMKVNGTEKSVLNKAYSDSQNSQLRVQELRKK